MKKKTKSKKFPLNWEEIEGQVCIYLNDSTLFIDKNSYKRCGKFQKEFWKKKEREEIKNARHKQNQKK